MLFRSQAMLERHVSGLAVVDAKGAIIGVVSEGDLIRRPEIETANSRSWWLRFFTSQEELARSFVKTHGVRAKDVMTQPAITVAPDAELAEVVRVLDAKRIKRVFVVDEGRLAGVITRADLLRALQARKALAAKAVLPNDKDIRSRVLQEIGKQADWTSGAVLNVQVGEGIVYLWGIVENESQRKALLLLVEGVPGVKSVVPHLAHRRQG